MSEERTVVFDRNILIRGTILCKTGLHIGGAKEELEIGGMDSPVIIDPKTRAPVIPGSSLKGKMRTLLELRDRKYSRDGSPHAHKDKCEELGCPICTIFGSSEDVARGPTRLIVRDAIMGARPELEIKTENVINRLTGKAEHPRSTERVPAGSEFDLEMVYSIYNKDDLQNLKTVFEALSLLEDNYLGGSGSRGYGKIKFQNLKLTVKTREDYINGTADNEPLEIEIDNQLKDNFTINELLQHFDELDLNHG